MALILSPSSDFLGKPVLIGTVDPPLKRDSRLGRAPDFLGVSGSRRAYDRPHLLARIDLANGGTQTVHQVGYGAAIVKITRLVRANGLQGKVSGHCPLDGIGH